MIDVKELRVGSLLQDSDGVIHRVDIIDCSNREHNAHAHMIDKIAIGTSLEFLNPIPLTEEWLNRIGAYNEPLEGPLGPYTNYWYIKDQEGVLIMLWRGSNDDWMYVINGYHDLKRKFFTLKYFHQLQNITFALTGQELTLNK